MDETTEILPVLRTKLYVPVLRDRVVSRSHLIDIIDQGLRAEHKLILLSAPAGFGKTTLLSEWVATGDLSVAWLTIDDGDNDLTRFLTYLVAALQTVHEGIGEKSLDLQRSPQPPSITGVLTPLINELVGHADRLVLVLDDYHLIDAESVHTALEFIVQNLPPHIHIILASRTEPPLSLPRLRGTIGLTEITERDLRFTHQETADYMNRIMGLGLSSEDVGELEARTEGWVVGLQMAALSMQGRQDITGFIRSLSGTHRFILDYLMEEVLERQREDVQQFMLQTAILEQLSSALCDEVLGLEFFEAHEQLGTGFPAIPPLNTSQDYLEYLGRENLFIVPLDDERRWYRFHRLFAEILQDKILQTNPGRIPELHRRASTWYEKQGMLTECVHHRMAAEDYSEAARLIARNALALVYQGNLATLVRWLEGLPSEVKGSQPWLSIAHAWALTFAGQLTEVAGLIREAEENLDRITDPLELRRISGIIDALRAYLLALRGSMSLAAEFAREALKPLPDEDHILRGFTAMLLATVLRWEGRLDEAHEAYQQAIEINQQAGDKNVLLETLCDLAGLQALQGKLRDSLDTCEQALSMARLHFEQMGTRLPAHGYACIRMSDILRERNELEQAREWAREGLELSQDWGQADLLVRVYIYSARALKACGDTSEAAAALRSAYRVASELSPWYIGRVEAWEADLNLECGDLTAVQEWAESQTVDGEIAFHDFESNLTLARVHVLTQPKSGRASESTGGDVEMLLDRLENLALETGAYRYLLEVQILQALHKQDASLQSQAQEIISSAVRIAAPEGFLRPFLRYGEAIRSLLVGSQAIDAYDDFHRDVEEALLELIPVDAPRPHPQLTGLPEPLSPRELEVLRMLPTHLSTTEIADELCVAPSTIRSHIKSIYSKLDVHSRTEAVDRATDLELL